MSSQRDTNRNSGRPTKFPGAFSATTCIRTLAQATGEVDGEEYYRVFTQKRASRGTAAGAVFWWLREQQTPPHPSEQSTVWKLCPINTNVFCTEMPLVKLHVYLLQPGA